MPHLIGTITVRVDTSRVTSQKDACNFLEELASRMEPGVQVVAVAMPEMYRVKLNDNHTSSLQYVIRDKDGVAWLGSAGSIWSLPRAEAIKKAIQFGGVVKPVEY